MEESKEIRMFRIDDTALRPSRSIFRDGKVARIIKQW